MVNLHLLSWQGCLPSLSTPFLRKPCPSAQCLWVFRGSTAGRKAGCTGCDLPGGSDGAAFQAGKYQLLTGSEDFSVNPLEIGALSRRGTDGCLVTCFFSLPGKHCLGGIRAAARRIYTPPGCSGAQSAFVERRKERVSRGTACAGQEGPWDV